MGSLRSVPRTTEAHCPSHSERHHRGAKGTPWQAAAVINQLLCSGPVVLQRCQKKTPHGQFKVLPRTTEARCPSHSERHHRGVKGSSWQAAAVINQLLCSSPVALSGNAYPAGNSTKGSLRSYPGPWHLPRWQEAIKLAAPAPASGTGKRQR